MDMNGKIAALLRDFAAIQKSKQSMWGYKRAAAAILTLEEPIESFLQPDGTLRKIPNIGPSSIEDWPRSIPFLAQKPPCHFVEFDMATL